MRVKYTTIVVSYFSTYKEVHIKDYKFKFIGKLMIFLTNINPPLSLLGFVVTTAEEYVDEQCSLNTV